MKKFNNFEDAFEWNKKIVEKGIELATFVVTNQVYNDSNEFTYRESGEMYQSGTDGTFSDFNEGIIIERKPYARRRYYEGGKAGAGNKKAQPRWFDKTVSKHKKEYLKQISDSLNQAKKEV